jgi:hypothetical protein
MASVYAVGVYIVYLCGFAAAAAAVGLSTAKTTTSADSVSPTDTPTAVEVVLPDIVAMKLTLLMQCLLLLLLQ